MWVDIAPGGCICWDVVTRLLWKSVESLGLFCRTQQNFLAWNLTVCVLASNSLYIFFFFFFYLFFFFFFYLKLPIVIHSTRALEKYQSTHSPAQSPGSSTTYRGVFYIIFTDKTVSTLFSSHLLTPYQLLISPHHPQPIPLPPLSSRPLPSPHYRTNFPPSPLFTTSLSFPSLEHIFSQPIRVVITFGTFISSLEPVIPSWCDILPLSS